MSIVNADLAHLSPKDPDWWRQSVVYQIYPRSFADANGDGLGDLRGIISRVPYLQSLGIDAVWLSPFYPSPLADGGYDVDDYRNVDPKLGTMDDFDALAKAAHADGIKIVVDIVPNHSSNLHEWFKAALKSRLKPRAKIIIICQRTAAYDMAGYIIKEHEENPTRRLRTIILPMLAGENDPLGRAPGDRLWPEWYTPEMVADLRKDEYIWKTMWQQEPPSDTGSWVSADDIHLVDEQFAPPLTNPSFGLRSFDT